MRNPLIVVIVAVGLFVAYNSAYIVDQRQSALVIRIGKVVGTKTKPGLYFKIPVFEQIEMFDNRILDLDAKPQEVIAGDRKRIIVDAFLKYKIVNPQAFRETVLDERGLKSKLESILESSLRQVIGKKPLNAMLTNERAGIMQEINDVINLQVSGKQQAKEATDSKAESKVTQARSDLGIEVIDVRIMRADLPKENSQAIYRRMQTEREKEAKQFRAEGEKEAKRIKAEADKKVTVMLANANRDAQILRGQGDAAATKIFAGAYNRDADFFEFYRTLQSYAKGLSSDSTTMVMSPNSDFLKYLRNINGSKR